MNLLTTADMEWWRGNYRRVMDALVERGVAEQDGNGWVYEDTGDCLWRTAWQPNSMHAQSAAINAMHLLAHADREAGMQADFFYQHGAWNYRLGESHTYGGFSTFAEIAADYLDASSRTDEAKAEAHPYLPEPNPFIAEFGGGA